MKKRLFILLAVAVLIAGMVWLAAVPALAEGDIIDVSANVLTWEGGNTYRVTGNVTTTSRYKVDGSVVLQLDEGATLSCAGIDVFSGNSLTIQGSGTLIADASSVYSAAGIGGNYDGAGRNSGTITINGGTITATGGQYGAGIGGGMYSQGGDIIINGGTVTATGGARGAGIGGGGNNNWAENYGTISSITINGGTVNATGGGTGAGIGSGGGAPGTSSTVKGGHIYSIIIRGGNVTATSSGGAGIGPGHRGDCQSITLDWTNAGDCINASSVTAEAYTLAEDLYYTADGNDYGAVTAENLPGKDASYLIRPNVYAFQGAGIQGSPYKIGSAADWEALCDLVSRGKGYYDSAYYRMTADITDIPVTTMLGTEAHPFRGTFDGDGHTLKVNLSGEGTQAPFRYIGKVTIKNLKVTGTVSGDRYSAGLAGSVAGWGSIISDVEVAAAISTNDTYCAGFIGNGGTCDMWLTECIFSGSIAGATTAGTFWGWSEDGAQVTITDCLDLSESTHPIGWGKGTRMVYNTYYTEENKVAGSGEYAWPAEKLGQKAWTVSAEPGLTIALAWDNTWTGVLYDGKIYVAEGETVIFTAKHTDSGEPVKRLVFEGPSGGEDILEPENGELTQVFTLTMPEGNGILSISPYEDMITVTYKDTDGSLLDTEYRLPGIEADLYRPEDRQGQRFTGWMTDAYGLLTDSAYGFDESTVLTAAWDTVAWGNITTAAGIWATDVAGSDITWANAGDPVTVVVTLSGVNIPEGQYYAGWTINGAAGEGTGFTMPGTDVMLALAFAEPAEIEINVTAAGTFTLTGIDIAQLAAVMENEGYLLTSYHGEYTSYSYDMNGDQRADMRLLIDEGTATLTRGGGADVLTQDYRVAGNGASEIYTFRFLRAFDTEFSGEGTQSSPWLIQSTEDWVALGELIEAGRDSAGQYFRLTDDIQIGTPVGSVDHPFRGSFNGFGHTLDMTLEGESGGRYMAPFRAIDNATISYLTTAGTVKGYIHAAGLVGSATGTNQIYGCEVTAQISCTGGGKYCGGIIGHGLTSEIKIQNSSFSGSISNATTAGTILGWSDEGAILRVSGCIDVSTSRFPIGLGGATCYGYNSAFYTCKNKYTTTEGIWSQEGVLAFRLDIGDGITLRQTMGSGTTYHGTYYMPGGEYLKIQVEKSDGMALNQILLDDGAGMQMVLTGENGWFEYKSPNANVTMTEYNWTPGLTVTGGTGYTYADGVLTINDAGSYTVSMAEGVSKAFDTIVTTGAATVTLNGVTIQSCGGTAMTVAEGTTIKLAGDNSITSSGRWCYGIATGEGGMTITSAAGDGSTDGTLTVAAEFSQAALGNNTTIRGGTVTTYGMTGIRSGLTVTGGTVRLNSDNSEAIFDYQVHVNYPQGKKAYVFTSDNGNTWTAAEGSPYTGEATATNLRKKCVLIREYEAPAVTVTDDGRTHLQEIYKDNGTDDPSKIYTRGTDDLDTVLGSMEDGIYTFKSDWPLLATKGGEPETEQLMENGEDDLYIYKCRLWPGSTLSLDKDSRWFYITYVDTDGVTELKRELRFIAGGQLWQPESDVPGQVFDGWLAPDGTRYAPGATVIIQEAMTLKISWTEKEWYHIYCLDGIQAMTFPELQAVTWAYPNDRITYSAEDVIVPKGKYFAGVSLNGEALHIHVFRMPAQDITIAAVLADQEIKVIDLSDGMESISEEAYYDLYDILDGMDDVFLGGEMYEDYSYEEFWDVNGDYDPDFSFRWDADGEFTGVYRASGADVLRRNYTLTYSWAETAFLIKFGNYLYEADLMLPGELTRIEDSAFEGDTSFTVVEIPEECTSIGKWAFKDCKGLKQIWIPEGCAVGTDAFEGCISVEIFGVAGSPAEAYCNSHANCTFKQGN